MEVAGLPCDCALGASGKVAFDSFGDNVTKTLTMYKVETLEFKPVKTGE